MSTQTDLRSSLAVLSERDLLGLRAAIEGSPALVAGLLAFLEHAVSWEIDRRAGSIYALQGPRAAIDNSEINTSLAALAVLAAQFRHDGHIESFPVAEFFDVVARTLSAKVERPDTLQ